MKWVRNDKDQAAQLFKCEHGHASAGQLWLWSGSLDFAAVCAAACTYGLLMQAQLMLPWAMTQLTDTGAYNIGVHPHCIIAQGDHIVQQLQLGQGDRCKQRPHMRQIFIPELPGTACTMLLQTFEHPR